MKKILFMLCFTLITVSACKEDKNREISTENFDSNFVHTVFFWLKNPENHADKSKFEASLSQFLENSKYAKTNFIGIPPKATRGVVDGSFTYSLVVTFASAEAQQGYQNEEVHLKFIEECKDLWSKVIVYDSNGIVQ